MQGRLRNIFVDVFFLFDDLEWSEICDAVGKGEISFEKDPNQFCFTFNLCFSKPVKASLLYKLFRLHNDSWERFTHDGAVRIKISCKNSDVFSSKIFSLVNEYLLITEKKNAVIAKEQDIQLKDSVVVINSSSNKQSDFFHRVDFHLKRFLEFVFDSSLQIEVNEEWSFANQSNLSKNGMDLFLFALDKKTDLAGNVKYQLGLSNWDKFYWLSFKDANSEKNKDFLEKIKINSWYNCKFDLYPPNSKYSGFVDGNLVSIQEVDKEVEPLKRDTQEKKLYPLCIHTKFSAFDGLYKYKDFAQKALQYGHKVLGVTDTISSQSFAEMEKISKEYGLNPVYGIEVEVLPDIQVCLINGENYVREGEYNIYSVLDIETSGLNPLIDELTEISVHKYSNKVKIGTYHSYVKIKKNIRAQIIDLTKITKEKLEKGGRDLVEVLGEVKEFVKGTILLAHNGIEFDLPFLNAKYVQNGMPPLSEPLLDSMRLSQALYTDKKSHSLEAICKRAGVEYVPEEAHSADYDVRALWQCFESELEPALQSKEFDIENGLKNLNETVFSPKVFSYAYGYSSSLYVKNQQGIRDLYELISIANTTNFYGKATVNYSTLTKLRSNLIVVSSPINSEPVALVFKDDEEGFKKILGLYDYIFIPPASHFDHYVHRGVFTKSEIEDALRKLLGWCDKYGKKVLFNSAIRYLDSREAEKYLVLIYAKAISGKRHYFYDRREKNDLFPDFSYKTTDELVSEYVFLNKENFLDLAYSNQEDFLSHISFDIEPVKKVLHPPKIEDCEVKLKRYCKKRIKELYGDKTPKFVQEKFETEVEKIIENNFAVIYWVSHLLVKESEKNGYLVGSRGSVGSSFVAYLLNISEVNPLPPHYYCTSCSYFEVKEDFLESGFDLESKMCPHCEAKLFSDGHNIPFETFLGFGGNKVPDIDLNFSGEYQIKAHNFLKKFFGEEKVYRAGTISAMAEKTSFAIVKTYVEEINKDGFYNNGKIQWLAKQIIDVKRTSGQHPGGILIVPNEYSIYDFSPINYPANDVTSDWLTTHFEFNDLHDALLKFDILGHDDPTTLAMLKSFTGVDPKTIPNNDPKVLELYRSGEVMGLNPDEMINDDKTGAIGLPEFGTKLTRKIIQICQPKSFADLIRISGFSHGTGVWKGNIDSLIKNKTHKLNEVITCRDDITIYLLSRGLRREDAFNISESIRKGMGVSEAQLEILKSHNVPDWYIESARKMSYIFPKAHATAYVLMSWKIAFYKLYYPLAFYASYFTLRRMDFDWDLLSTNNPQAIKERYLDISKRLKSKSWDQKISVKTKEKSFAPIYEVALEFLQRGFKFKHLDINKSSFATFQPINETKELLIPFTVVEGLGEIKAKQLVQERDKNGDFVSLDDLSSRAKLNKTVIKKLIDSNVIPQEWTKKVEISEIIKEN